MMTYNEAKKFHHQQWKKGRFSKTNEPYVFPYNFRYTNDVFRQTEVEINKCRIEIVDENLIGKYMQMMQNQIDLGPVWIQAGKRLQDDSDVPFWDHKYRVLDGNHRLEARKRLGYLISPAILPLPQIANKI